MQDLNELIEKMSGIRQSILSETSDLSDSKMVYEMKKTFLDKNGRIGQMMRFMREIDPPRGRTSARRLMNSRTGPRITSAPWMRR